MLRTPPRFTQFHLVPTIHYLGEMGEGALAVALFNDCDPASPAFGATVAVLVSHLTPASLDYAIRVKRRQFSAPLSPVSALRSPLSAPL